MLTRYHPTTEPGGERQRIRVFLKRVPPEEEFLARVRELDRITKVAIRFKATKNPGISALLGEAAREANAGNVGAVTLTASPYRNSSINTETGILPWATRLRRDQIVREVRAEGLHEGTLEKFSTERMEEKRRIEVELDRAGKANTKDVFAKLSSFVDSVVFQ